MGGGGYRSRAHSKADIFHCSPGSYFLCKRHRHDLRSRPRRRARRPTLRLHGTYDLRAAHRLAGGVVYAYGDRCRRRGTLDARETWPRSALSVGGRGVKAREIRGEVTAEHMRLRERKFTCTRCGRKRENDTTTDSRRYVLVRV